MIGQTRTLSLTVLSLLLFDFGWGIAAEPQTDYQQTGVQHLDQGWTSGWKTGQSNWFHHASQGTMMVPYDLFMALEQPTKDPAMPTMGMFSEPKYLSRFGFIPSVQDQDYNPGNLPIGFSIAHDWVDPNRPASSPFTALGFTCAACHTSEITYKGTRLRIEGGSAMINLSDFQTALGMALLITNSSSKKFDAFAERLIAGLGIPPQMDAKAKAQLEAAATKQIKDKLEQVVLVVTRKQRQNAKLQLRTFEAGFGRTDALALIGNEVFGKLNSMNLTKADAPVNYPHLWDTPWFYWVQYNASIRLPMVRNIGEALGVGAAANLNFESTVNIENLHFMEEQVAGDQPFTGLKAPAWPEKLFGEIDGFQQQTGKWKKGKALYEKLCIHCHYRIENYEFALSLDATDKRYKKHWSKPNRFGRQYMKLPLINYVDLGTDPAAVVDFYQRIVYTGSLDTNRSTMSAGEALAIATANVREREYVKLGLSAAEYAAYDGYRELKPEPSAIARLDYKARPLNGIWATAPFLHNGSVANLHELLLPADQRMSTFYLGSMEFDPKHVGFATDPNPQHFRMNTTLPGNLNTGHEFRNLTAEEEASLSPFQRERVAENKGWAVNGVVGPELKPDERWALIEYLKSLGSPQAKKPVSLEDPPPGESTFIKRLAGASAAQQRATDDGKAHRGQHPKNHGAVWARFRVANDLPNRLKVGIFRRPNDYNCVIRFSNGKEKSDQAPDAHGMAIKVFFPGTSDQQEPVTQDFVLADNPVFFAKSVEHLLEFLAKAQAAKGDPKAMISIALTSHPALNGFKKQLKTSPLQATYWSQTPYNFGGSAVKYQVVPDEGNGYPALQPAKDPTNSLRQAMVQRLTRQKMPVSFDFYIQEQTDPQKTPVENPTIEWNSTPIKLATITIYPQKFDSKQQMEFCENLSFTPWRGLDEHRPLGGINRARKSIYEQSRELRHQTNKVEDKEPTGRESF